MRVELACLNVADLIVSRFCFLLTGKSQVTKVVFSRHFVIDIFVLVLWRKRKLWLFDEVPNFFSKQEKRKIVSHLVCRSSHLVFMVVNPEKVTQNKKSEPKRAEMHVATARRVREREKTTTQKTCTCINLVLQMALWRVVIFCRHALSPLTPEPNSRCKHFSLFLSKRQVVVWLRRYLFLCVLVFSHSTFNSQPIVYFFVSHLTHITYHIEWRWKLCVLSSLGFCYSISCRCISCSEWQKLGKNMKVIWKVTSLLRCAIH